MIARPRVSILLPVFDGADTLAGCLRSIRRQTEADWQCVIVDDGSRDASVAVAREFAAQDERFEVFERPHRGLVAALQEGLVQCRADYVARMDADDWMHRARLQRQCEALDSNADWAGAGCHVRLFPRTGLMAGMREYESWLNSIDSPRRLREEAFVECPIAHPTWMLRRELLLDLGYRDCGWPEDFDLILRALAAGFAFGVVPERLLGWRQRAGRLSRTSSNYTADRFTACRAQHLADWFLSGVDRYALWGYGATGRALQRELRQRGKRPAVILELHPGRIGNEIAGAPVVHPDQWLQEPSHRLIASVAGADARARIRAALARAGLQETVDYVCAA